MKKLKVAFDVDNTLIDAELRPLHKNIALLIAMSTQKNVDVFVWSGGGKDYAQHHVDRLGLKPYVRACYGKHIIQNRDTKFECPQEHTLTPDITFDDQHEVDFGCPNVIVFQK